MEKAEKIMGWIITENGNLIHTSEFKVSDQPDAPKEFKDSIQLFDRWASIDEIRDIAANWIQIEDSLEKLDYHINYEGLMTGAPNMVARVLESVNKAFGKNTTNEST